MVGIKFRGKRIDDDEWVHGYYVYDRLQDVHYIFDNKILGAWKSEVIPETVGQYTGLKDNQSDKEVCAGDKLIITDGDYEAIGVVVWNNKKGQ